LGAIVPGRAWGSEWVQNIAGNGQFHDGLETRAVHGRFYARDTCAVLKSVAGAE